MCFFLVVITLESQKFTEVVMMIRKSMYTSQTVPLQKMFTVKFLVELLTKAIKEWYDLEMSFC